MRDVEQRLGKPDPSEDTQKKQKQIVKRIETLIEQVKQSGSSGGRMVMRRVRRPGQQPGQQQGDQTGCAGPRRSADEAGQADHPAFDRRRQGHLGPPPARAAPGDGEQLQGDGRSSSKRELIDRYFLSVSKGKLVREE